MTMKLSLIVAMTEAGLIGRAGGLPWHLPADLARFKQRTWGHWIVMGRKTYESIGRALPGRTSVVITRQTDYAAPPDVRVAASLDEALGQASAAGQSEVFVIGGGEIYAQALPRADRIYVTRVEAKLAGDTYFPPLDATEWRLTDESRRAADEKNEYPCLFQTYERVAETAVR